MGKAAEKAEKRLLVLRFEGERLPERATVTVGGFPVVVARPVRVTVPEDTTEVVVDDIILVGGQGGPGREAGRAEESQESRPKGPAAGPRAERVAPPAAPADDFGPGITDDDVPF